MPVFETNKPKLTFGMKEEVELKPIEDKLAKGAVTLKQTGSLKDIQRDATRFARLPGKRISKSGKAYWETRKNRSDMLGKRV